MRRAASASSAATSPAARSACITSSILDAQTVTVLDGASTLYSGRAYGVADRGIGQVVFGMLSGSSSGSPFRIDDLTVSGTAVQQIPAVIEFLPATRLGVSEPPDVALRRGRGGERFDQIVPDGTTVDLELASGPVAAIGGASATTSLGRASFLPQHRHRRHFYAASP